MYLGGDPMKDGGQEGVPTGGASKDPATAWAMGSAGWGRLEVVGILPQVGIYPT